jgi:hypothetical protein
MSDQPEQEPDPPAVTTRANGPLAHALASQHSTPLRRIYTYLTAIAADGTWFLRSLLNVRRALSNWRHGRSGAPQFTAGAEAVLRRSTHLLRQVGGLAFVLTPALASVAIGDDFPHGAAFAVAVLGWGLVSEAEVDAVRDGIARWRRVALLLAVNAGLVVAAWLSPHLIHGFANSLGGSILWGLAFAALVDLCNAAVTVGEVIATRLNPTVAPPIAPPIPPNVFVTDDPTDLQTNDAFGHRAYAQAIADILGQAKAPFTLGVFGDWGFGKTSIINEVGRLLPARGCAFASFDVWRYEGDALRRQFLRDVAEQLSTGGFLRSRYRPEKELRDLKVDVATTEQRINLSFRGLVVALLQGAVLGFLVYILLKSHYPAELLGTKSGGGSKADIAGLIVAAASVAASLINQIIRVDQKVVSLRRIEEPERFLEKFHDLLAAIRCSRLVVAIDNLDRCSPELVDELLATIKTYLEPEARRASKRKTPTVVFMVAADESAIRRHMLARELEARSPSSRPSSYAAEDGVTTSFATSASANNGDKDQARRDDAERYVDEYLRKFFTATIRLKTMLDEEIRSYAAAQLTAFIAAHGPSDTSTEFENRLVSMVASALRKNPRRIKQFVNSLETKLQVIKARELDGKIIPPISDDVLGIAKVTIIEEEWRSRYEELDADWRKLHAWQSQLGTHSFPDHDFSAFLRTTRDIDPRDLPAILSLKQTRAEREMPGFNRFREALTLGQLEEARQIVATAPEEARVRYAGALRAMMETEARAGRAAEALNVLEGALTIPELAPTPTAQRDMLSYGLAHGDIARNLSNLDPTPLFGLRSILPKGEQDQLTGAFIDISRTAQAGPERARAAAEGLAQVLDDLPAAQVRSLENQIASEPFASSSPDIYLPLVRMRPHWVYDSTVESVFQRWMNASQPPDSSDVQLAILGFSVGRAAARVPELFAQISAKLQVPGSTKTDLVAALLLAENAVGQIPTIDDGSLRGLAAGLNVTLTNAMSSSDDELTVLVIRVLRKMARAASAAAAPDALQPLVTALANERPHILAETALDEPADHLLRERLLDALSQVIHPAYGRDRMHSAAQALINLDPASAPDRIAAQVTLLMNQDQLDGVSQLILTFQPQLGARTKTLIASLMTRARAQVASARTPFLVASSDLWQLMDADDRELLVEELRSMLVSGDPADINTAIAFIQSPEAQVVQVGVLEALGRAAHSIASSGWQTIFTPTLNLIVARWHEIEQDARGALTTATATWMRSQPGLVTTLLDSFASFDGSAQERTTLVEGALDAERQIGAFDEKARIIFGAWRVQGPEGRIAARLVDERIASIQASDDPSDQAVWQSLKPLLPA